MNMKLTAKSQEFCRWADEKERNIPKISDDLHIEISDINHIRFNEIQKIKENLKLYNCCIYSSSTELQSNDNLLALARLIGMNTYDASNIHSSAISTITFNKNSDIPYIPYTNKALNWHTDGYYDEKEIFSWLLHCVEPANTGGDNYFMDHELVMREYILKYDNIDILTNKDAFIIPGNKLVSRPNISSYIFSFDNKYNKLHMKFSMRKENIDYNRHVACAIKNLKEIIEKDCKKYCLTYRLSKNEGIISNNILHGRNSYNDDKIKRKLLRIRSYERI
mgnify:FL=1